MIKGEPIATLYATSEAMLAEPAALLQEAITVAKTPPEPVPLIGKVFTRENAEAHLRNAVR